MIKYPVFRSSFSPTVTWNISAYWSAINIFKWQACSFLTGSLLPSFGCWIHPLQFSSVAQSCLILSDPTDCSMPGLPVHHQFPEFTRTHVHWVSGAIQPSHQLSSPSPPTFNFSQHQGLVHWVRSSHQVAKVLEFQLQTETELQADAQLQHQSFQWIFRTDLL